MKLFGRTKEVPLPALAEKGPLPMPADEFVVALHFVKTKSFTYEFVRPKIPYDWRERLGLPEGIHGGPYQPMDDSCHIDSDRALTGEERSKLTIFLGKLGYEFVRAVMREGCAIVDRPDYQGTCTLLDGVPYPDSKQARES